jgi:hypothetical protein
MDEAMVKQINLCTHKQYGYRLLFVVIAIQETYALCSARSSRRIVTCNAMFMQSNAAVAHKRQCHGYKLIAATANVGER